MFGDVERDSEEECDRVTSAEEVLGSTARLEVEKSPEQAAGVLATTAQDPLGASANCGPVLASPEPSSRGENGLDLIQTRAVAPGAVAENSGDPPPGPDEVRDLSSYVTDVRRTSVGLLHLFSDVDVRTASLPTGSIVPVWLQPCGILRDRP